MNLTCLFGITPEVAAAVSRLRVSDLSTRVSEIADQIDNLRINSAGQYVIELRAISRELRIVAAAPEKLEDERQQEAEGLVEKAIQVLANLLEVAGTNESGRIAISAAAALLVGGVGASGAWVFTVSMAVFAGKEAFLKALERWKGG